MKRCGTCSNYIRVNFVKEVNDPDAIWDVCSWIPRNVPFWQQHVAHRDGAFGVNMSAVRKPYEGTTCDVWEAKS